MGAVRTQHGEPCLVQLNDLLGLLPAEVILQVCLFFLFGHREKQMWWRAQTRTLPVGGTENEFCVYIVLLYHPPVPLHLSPTHFSFLVNSVIIPYLKYLVVTCHCNSPRELLVISLIYFLTLNILLCVLPLYLFGICKMSGIQHRRQELKGKQNTDMACDWRGGSFFLWTSSCQPIALPKQSLTALLLRYDPVRQEAQGGVKWGCPLTYFIFRKMWRAAAKKCKQSKEFTRLKGLAVAGRRLKQETEIEGMLSQDGRNKKWRGSDLTWLVLGHFPVNLQLIYKVFLVLRVLEQCRFERFHQLSSASADQQQIIRPTEEFIARGPGPSQWVQYLSHSPYHAVVSAIAFGRCKS